MATDCPACTFKGTGGPCECPALDWTPQQVTNPCPSCGKQAGTFACKMRCSIHINTGTAKAAND